MTHLKEALHDLAAQGPPLGDVAERAIMAARRRRAAHRVTLVAAVAAVTAVLLQVIQSHKTAEEPTMGERTVRTIAFRNGAPEPLPDGPTTPVLLAYTVKCWPIDLGCQQWRVLTLNGQEFQVRDAIAPEKDGNHGGVLSVASDGSRIAYFDAKGRFVIRDTRTGTVSHPLSVPLKVLAATTPHVAWAPDGRRVTVDFSPLDDDKPTNQPAVLIDVTTMKVTRLPRSCCVLGVPSGDASIPMYDAYEAGVGDGLMRFLRDDGSLHSIVPIGAVESETVYSLDPQWSVISADGLRLATLMWPQGPKGPRRREETPEGTRWVRDETPELTIVDTRRATMSGHYRFPVGFQLTLPMLAGWRDPDTVLIALLWDNAGIYAIDTATGESYQLIDFPTRPARLSVATALL
ncbi:hypothetical protein J5X84_32965 [Streptosporangiaceae bacterium NEAU-GS5]|nr:hypothetical protein [Streptosporangiaceae bacterium NEAU-GS5]